MSSTFAWRPVPTQVQCSARERGSPFPASRRRSRPCAGPAALKRLLWRRTARPTLPASSSRPRLAGGRRRGGVPYPRVSCHASGPRRSLCARSDTRRRPGARTIPEEASRVAQDGDFPCRVARRAHGARRVQRLGRWLTHAALADQDCLSSQRPNTL